MLAQAHKALDATTKLNSLRIDIVLAPRDENRLDDSPTDENPTDENAAAHRVRGVQY
jgi:hypothetical protein